MNTKILKHLENMAPILVSQQINKESILVSLPQFEAIIFNLLKNHIGAQHKLLSCVSGVDFLGKIFRFGVVYDLLSLRFNHRLRIKFFVNETTTISSLTPIYSNANWWEREIWDLFGIFFEKHPDLRRILTDYGFEGYPMRKDFPLYGFIELRYDEQIKRIAAEPVELAQDLRRFEATA